MHNASQSFVQMHLIDSIKIIISQLIKIPVLYDGAFLKIWAQDGNFNLWFWSSNVSRLGDWNVYIGFSEMHEL